MNPVLSFLYLLSMLESGMSHSQNQFLQLQCNFSSALVCNICANSTTRFFRQVFQTLYLAAIERPVDNQISAVFEECATAHVHKCVREPRSMT